MKKTIVGLIVIFLVTPPIYYFYTQYQEMSAEYKKTKILLDKSSEVLDQTVGEELVLLGFVLYA